MKTVLLLILGMGLLVGVLGMIYMARSVVTIQSYKAGEVEARSVSYVSSSSHPEHSEPLFAERPPELSQKMTPRSSQASGGLEAWKSLDALAPEDPSTPVWVATAAKSNPWSQAFAGRMLEGRQPGPKEGDRDRLVGYSDQFEPTLELSRSRAREAAIDQIVTLSLWQLSEPQGDGPFTDGDFERLRRAIAAQHRREFKAMERDWYTQSVPIQREAVYRSAVLFKAPSTEKLRSAGVLALAMAREGRLARRRELLLRAGLVIAGAIGVLGVYAAANSASKGHYAWTLRIVSALAFGAILFFIIMA